MCILDFVMGGCVSLNQFERHHQPNIFHVYNVNEFGVPVSPGHIELTDSSLVLHQKSNRESVVWPMRSLRRYGFDAELFSFESGRRCTTGPGVYAFKCRRAEQLFSMLQDKILSSGQDNLSNHSGILHSPPSTLLALQLPASIHVSNTHNPTPPPVQIVIRQENIPDPDYLEPIVINRSNSNTSQSQAHNYVNDIRAVPENETVVNYVNTSPEHLQRHLSSSSDTQAQVGAESTVGSSKSVTRGHSLDETNYAKLDDLLKQEHTANRHLYMNVTASGGVEMVDSGADDDDTEPFSCDHCYANVAPGTTSLLTGINNKPLRPSKSMFSYPQQAVNYAILDLQKRSRNNNIIKMNETTEMAANGVGLFVPANETVEGYAKIDFDKTTALSNSINPTLDDDKSVRKTRHNSNASSLLLLKRTSLAATE